MTQQALPAVTLALLALATLAPLRAEETAGARATAQLVGGWSLASRVTTRADGTVVKDPTLAATPAGVLIYDRFGHVAAQLARQGRTLEMLPAECRAAEQVRGTDDTAQTILGYDAYFGTYTVDAQAGIVTHHLQSALFPGDIGKSIRRHFSIAGDTLRIRFDTSLPDGTRVTRTLVWKRMNGRE